MQLSWVLVRPDVDEAIPWGEHIVPDILSPQSEKKSNYRKIMHRQRTPGAAI